MNGNIVICMVVVAVGVFLYARIERIDDSILRLNEAVHHFIPEEPLNAAQQALVNKYRKR